MSEGWRGGDDRGGAARLAGPGEAGSAADGHLVAVTDARSPGLDQTGAGDRSAGRRRSARRPVVSARQRHAGQRVRRSAVAVPGQARPPSWSTTLREFHNRPPRNPRHRRWPENGDCACGHTGRLLALRAVRGPADAGWTAAAGGAMLSAARATPCTALLLPPGLRYDGGQGGPAGLDAAALSPRAAARRHPGQRGVRRRNRDRGRADRRPVGQGQPARRPEHAALKRHGHPGEREMQAIYLATRTPPEVPARRSRTSGPAG